MALVVGVGWGVMAVGAPAGATLSPVTFNGTCQMAGTTSFSGSSATFIGTGTCNGEYLGINRAIQGAELIVHESGLITSGFPILATGTGSIVLESGGGGFDPSRPFLTFSVTQVANAFVLRGSVSGQAVGLVVPGNGNSANVTIATVGNLDSPQ